MFAIQGFFSCATRAAVPVAKVHLVWQVEVDAGFKPGIQFFWRVPLLPLSFRDMGSGRERP